MLYFKIKCVLFLTWIYFLVLLDFGIVLGCKLFIKEISTKARDQLLATNQYLVEGDFITKVNNTNCNDMMSLKEAKKIIDNCKDKLNLTIARDISNNATISHQTQSSVSTTGAVNNYYKGKMNKSCCRLKKQEKMSLYCLHYYNMQVMIT